MQRVRQVKIAARRGGARRARLPRNQPLNNQDKHRQPAGIQQREIRHRVMHQLGTLQQNQAAAGGEKKNKNEKKKKTEAYDAW